MCIRPRPGRASPQCSAMRWKSSPRRAAARSFRSRPAIRRAAFSNGAAMWPRPATRLPLAVNGSPTPRWSSRSSLRRQRGCNETRRPAVPAPLGLLPCLEIRGDRDPGRGGARVELLSLVSLMSRERLYLFDTTLRDGAQTNGVDFTLADKIAIARMLDELGVDYVEAGYPGANPTDTEFFVEKRPMRARLTAFGMTRRPGRSASNDPGLVGLLDAQADAICFVAKSWDYHVRVALETTEDENLASIRDSVRAAKAKGREVLLDCEHFFDGYKAKPAYALACAQAAYEEGARWVVLCDTNGGTLPHEVERIVGEVCAKIPGDHVGIHAHNDTEQAVANSFAAVRAGARQIQGTLNGLGERCGNANLISIIPTLKLKPEYAQKFDIGVPDDELHSLAHVSHTLDEMLNRAPDRHAPYVGESAFATKAGIHASAILKEPATYEHVAPETVGNRRKLLVSDQSGRSNVLAELERIGLSVDKDDPRVVRLLDEVKDREAIG